MTKALQCLIATLLIAALASPARAQVTDPQRDLTAGSLKDLTVEQLLDLRIRIASVEGDDIFTTPSTVSVIDAATLKRYNIESIAEALDLLPTVHVGRTYFWSNVPTIRGVLGDQYSNKVLILINGVPTWAATNGEGAFFRIAVQDVDRIEVLRGPASVMYGTNAYAGAVNIVLKSSVQRRVEADSGVGDQGGNAGVSASFGAGETSYLLSAHAGRRTGDPWTFVDQKNKAGEIRDFQDDRMLTLSIQGPRHTVLANAFSFSENFLGTRVTFASGAGHDRTRDGLLLAYSYSQPLSARADLTAGVAYDGDWSDHPRSADDQEATDKAGYRASAFAKSSLRLGSRLSLDVGTDYDFRKSVNDDNYRRDTGVVLDDNNLRDRGIHEYSGFWDATYRPGRRLSVVGGSRLTKNELYGTNLSSRGAVVYTPRERQSIKLLFGQSFRAPSLYELYRESTGGGSYGNLNLTPETSDSVEAAYVTSFRGLFLQTNVYHARYRGKISRVRRYPDFVSDPNDRSEIYVNRGDFSGNGVELELTYDVPGVVNTFLLAGYVDGDRGDAEPGSNNYNFRYVPNGSISAGVSKQVRHLSASVVVNWLQSTNGWYARVPGHTSFDLTLGYEQRAGKTRLKHSLFAKDLLGGDDLTPEYLRGGVNAVPYGLGPRVGYRIQLGF